MYHKRSRYFVIYLRNARMKLLRHCNIDWCYFFFNLRHFLHFEDEGMTGETKLTFALYIFYISLWQLILVKISTIIFFAPCTQGKTFDLNTDLHSNSNISKTLRVNVVFPRIFLKEYSTRVIMVSRLTDFALVVLKLLMFKVGGIIDIKKIEFSDFSNTERAKVYFYLYVISYIIENYLIDLINV